MASNPESQLPVFVFPSSIQFYTEDQASYKQIITLYNPYEFNLRFKILSTAPHKYSVVDSEGVIKSRCCVDIVIRHNEVSMINENVRDKFRITVYDTGNVRKILGHKDLVAVLQSRKTPEGEVQDRFESLATVSPNPVPTTASTQQQTFAPLNANRVNFLIMATAASCVVALMMPNQSEESSMPSYLRVSLNQKLIAAYILGLVTMALLRA